MSSKAGSLLPASTCRKPLPEVLGPDLCVGARQLAMLTELIRDTYVLFDKVISVHPVMLGSQWKRHVVAVTHYGRLYGLKLRNNERLASTEETASRLAVLLSAPNAYQTFRVRLPDTLHVPGAGLLFARDERVNLTEWPAGEKHLSRLFPEELAELRRPGNVESFLGQMGEWMGFAEIFGQEDTDMAGSWIIVPGGWRLQLTTAATAFTRPPSWGCAFRWHLPWEEIAALDVTHPTFTHLAAGMAQMIDKYRERESEVRQILAESETGRGWEPHVPEPTPEWIFGKLQDCLAGRNNQMIARPLIPLPSERGVAWSWRDPS